MIQETNQTTGVVKGTANVPSGENVVDTTVNKSQKPRRKKKVKTQFELTLEKARSIYRTQINKSAETKKEAIRLGIGKLDTSYTLENFLPEFIKRTYRLLDSTRFKHDCEKLNMEVTAVAQHVAFTGLRRTYNVLDNGLRSEFNNHLSEMKEHIFTLEELRLYDTEKLLPDQQQPFGSNGRATESPKE